MTQENYTVGIYCRLSKDDNLPGESMSIGTQRAILMDYCEEHGYEVYDTYIDDGYSGLNFIRPDFQRMMDDIDKRRINMVITKDLSRLGRDYIMTGYYTEIFFPSEGIRYVALSDNFDTENEENDIAPFKNILNDMYARDISRKVRNAKRQRAKQGLFIASQAPYGYKISEENKNKLTVDPEAAETVKLIFVLALLGMGDVLIAQELKARKILRPSAYKYRHGDKRFARHGDISEEDCFSWAPATIRKILTDRVHIGDMVNHKFEIANYKTKKMRRVPPEEHIVVLDTHEAIISREDFEQVQKLRAQREFPKERVEKPLFQGLLFCSDCSSALSVAKRQLKDGEDDLYRCMKHVCRPDICPETHAIYHKKLYDFVLSELKSLAKSLKRKRIQSGITEYSAITELTPAVLNAVIDRIEIGHMDRKTPIRDEVVIRWKL